MKAFLCVFFLATAALAMPQHGGHYPVGPSHGHFPSHYPSHGHGHGHYPHRPVRPEISRELRELMMDLMDFQRLYPVREIERIVMSHWEDEQLHETIDFLQTREFHEILEAIAEAPEIAALGEYLENANWPWINEVMVEAIETIQSRRIAGRNAGTGGLNALLDAVVEVLPKEELRALFDEKYENRAVFRAVVDILTSDEVKGLVANVKNSATLKTQFDALAAKGIEVEKVYNTALAFFGL